MRQFLANVLARWRRFLDAWSSTPTAGGRIAMPTDEGQSMATEMPMLDCEQVMRQLWDYLDGELAPASMGAIRAHVDLCKRCYPQYEFERSFLAAVAARAPQHSDPERLRMRLMNALQAQGLDDA